MAANRGGAFSWWLTPALTMPAVRNPALVDRETSLNEVERVPSSLESIIPILRAANEIEHENPRVAYLCRFTAYEKVHLMDPNSRGRGVRQFKTYLLHRLEKDEQETRRKLASTDARELMMFFELYRKKNLEGSVKGDKGEMDRHYVIASVLYDVMKTVTPEKFHSEFDKYMIGVEKPSSSIYNILPLDFSDSTQPAMEIPEIKAAVELLCGIDNLPKQRSVPTSASHMTDAPIARDLFDWLGRTFGFQKGNVANQKEHLILLLANIDMRKGNTAHQSDSHNQVIHSDTVTFLTRKTFQNYISWCQYLHLKSNIKIPRGNSTQQPELLYLGLYLLIWGEASNVRFMPECLCYIFHHMAGELYGIISIRKDYFDPVFGQEGNDDAFLQRIIQPLFKVMQKETELSNQGTASFSSWRNYDDLNEFFWSEKRVKRLNWPMDPTCDFFTIPLNLISERKEGHPVNRRRVRKTNFVEIRTFFLLFRSFDRMWSLFILSFQAMLIIAWSPSGSLSAILEPTVFRKVLTIFITDAFLNFVQATLEILFNWRAWRSLECSQTIRYILKFAVAFAWLIILPTTYLSSIQDYTGLFKCFPTCIGSFKSQSSSIYNIAITLYMLPNILSGFIFIFLPFQRALQHSNSRIIEWVLWWTQVTFGKSYAIHFLEQYSLRPRISIYLGLVKHIFDQ